MALSRRDFLKTTAAASALSALPAPALAAEDGDTRWTKSVCRYCGTGCGLYVGARGDQVVAVRGDPEDHNAGFLCVKGALLPQILSAPDRLLHPLIRKGNGFQRASWDEAMGLVAAKFQEAIQKFGPDAVGFYGSGQGLTEETYAANKLFKAGLRTNNVDGNPRLCMASATAGYVGTYGKDEPMGCYEDLDHADVFLIIGSNTAEAHPVLFRRIVRRKEAGRNVKVIVLDPRRTATSRIADLHLSFKPGADLAILNAMAHVLFAEGLVDDAFMKDQVAFGEGAEANKTRADYEKSLAACTPQAAAALAGCNAEDIVRAARWFGEKGRTATSLWCMGLNQRTQGVWVNQLVHNLHLVTGKIGVPGSTPLSLTGQPNACGGVRDGGALSHLLPYGRVVANEKHRAEMEKLWGVAPGTISPKPGLPTVDLFRALEDGKLKCLYVMCTNPGQSLPNVDRYRKAMRREGAFLVVTEAFHPTRTSELADVVLPAALWAEKEGVYGCTERRYHLLERAVAPRGEARPDLDILCDLAARLGHGKLLPFKAPAEAWTEILETARGTAYDFSGMTRARLQQSHGLLWPLPSAGHPGTKRRYVRGEDPFVPADHPLRMKFYGRPDGRAVVWFRPQRDPGEVVDAAYPLWFTTGRVLEHWHTGTMTRNCRELRHANAEALAELHPQDAARLGVKDGDRVRVSSRRGAETFRAKVAEGARLGVVFVQMHDPDHLCNRVTHDAVDPVSRQPEFKICAVKLEKA
ncbi:molybdopterin oxidoreductase family protein [Anaeromyxobacter diazotrophicus]|uniref:nitrate reductase (cytochrome) n=1 Tax=Anaeromyxobacter diazotrophicus TaxID=2590199 RepID=A0A7I9VJ71_9BACT|nr:nitrate reductase [Anaeromyxobacter diazotrophicus]GEJ56077.1 nitrate reductase catalytic subunit [Anaeromyxobacter diazotrophicus]